MKALLIGLILNFTVQAQDSIDFGRCQVLRIDSIDYCTSHYSINFITDIDTFTTVIEKELVDSPITSLMGKTANITGVSMNALVLNHGIKTIKIGIVQAQESHPDTNTYSSTRYSYKVRKNLWKKEFVRITLSSLEFNKSKTCVRITKLEGINN